jgi:hypothetical protein
MPSTWRERARRSNATPNRAELSVPTTSRAGRAPSPSIAKTRLRPLKDEIAANLYHQRPSVEKGNIANPETGWRRWRSNRRARSDGAGAPRAHHRRSYTDALALIVARGDDGRRCGALRRDAAAVPLADKLTLSLAEPRNSPASRAIICARPSKRRN